MTLIKCFVVVLGEPVAEEVFMSFFGHAVQVRADGDEGVLTATHSEEPQVRVGALS